MKRYHINPETGKPGECTASIRGCKYVVNGQLPEHYDTKEDAQKSYEKQNSSKTIKGITQKKAKVLKKLTESEIKELNGTVYSLSNGSYMFEQNEWKTGPSKGELHDELLFSDESELEYVIIEKDGEFLIKTDYGMLQNDLSKFKPITNEFEPDILLDNVSEHFEGQYSVWEPDPEFDDENEPLYIKDFAEQQFGELSKLLKKRYGVK